MDAARGGNTIVLETSQIHILNIDNARNDRGEEERGAGRAVYYRGGELHTIHVYSH